MSGIRQGAVFLAIWFGARIMLQIVWLILLARALGAEGYGLFSGLASSAVILGNMISASYGIRMIRTAANDSARLAASWLSSIAFTFVSIVPLSLMYGMLAYVLLPDSLSMLALGLVALSELLFVPLMKSSYYAFQAKREFNMSGFVIVMIPAFNIGATLAFFLSGSSYISEYLVFHCVGSGLGAASAVFVVLRSLRIRCSNIKDIRIRPLPFSYGTVSLLDSASEALDKVVVLALTSAQMTGMYSAAHRFTVAASSPIQAASAAALPTLFSNTGADDKRNQNSIYGLLVASILYGIAAGVVVWLGAPYLTMLLGDSFAEIEEMVRVMVLIPLGLCLYYAGGTVLISMGKTALRIVWQATGIVSGVVALIALAPDYGAYGIAWSLHVAVYLPALLMWASYFYIQTR